MPASATETPSHERRSAAGCLCCGSGALRRETHIVSAFLAARAWGGRPTTNVLSHCQECGFRFFERGLSPAEAARYYRNYRDAGYIAARRRWEPFYTPGQHAAQVEWARSPQRTEALRQALAAAGAPTSYGSALDHGGDEGHMLAAIEARRKAVFDPSGRPALAGIERFADAGRLTREWDLILSCQVLEHVSAPDDYLCDLARLLKPGGRLYVEVPCEQWRSGPGAGPLRDTLLRLLPRVPPLLVLADTLCTVSRVKFGRLPPFGFVAMREHLNYFSPAALEALLRRHGFRVDAAGINTAGQIFAVAGHSSADAASRP